MGLKYEFQIINKSILQDKFSILLPPPPPNLIPFPALIPVTEKSTTKIKAENRHLLTTLGFREAKRVMEMGLKNKGMQEETSRKQMKYPVVLSVGNRTDSECA